MLIRWMLLRLRGRRSLPEAIVNLVEFTVYFFIVAILYTFGIKLTENISWNEAIWQVWQTATTVGYGNSPAETVAGRNVTMVFGVLAVATVGVIISSAFDIKQYFTDKRRLGMLDNPYRDGYVVFNYPGENISLFIQEIVSGEPDVGLCIVDSRLEELPSTATALHNKIHFVRGYTHEQETYDRARIRDNKRIIIFPVDPSSPESDLGTSRLVDLVLRFVSEQTQVIYILIDPKNKWMFNKKAVAVLQNLEMLATVQECQDTYSSLVVQNILMNTEGANTQTVRPQKIVGQTWGDFVTQAVKVSESLQTPFNALALVHEEEIDACPDSARKIAAGDMISVIANNDFDWENFEQQLVES